MLKILRAIAGNLAVALFIYIKTMKGDEVMAIQLLYHGVFVNSKEMLSKLQKKKKRKSCILTSCREELYFDTDKYNIERDGTSLKIRRKDDEDTFGL